MKILFAVIRSFAPPLGIMCLSAVLKKYGSHITKVVNLNYDNIRDELLREPYDMLAFSITDFDSFYFSSKIAKKIKQEFKIMLCLGGAHVGLFDFDLGKSNFDAVCVGEGEYALLEFAEKFDRHEFLGSIMNWWININNKIYKNDVRPLIDNLDQLPFPDRELCRDFVHTKKAGLFDGMEVHFVSVSRGCYFPCTYCYNAPYRKLYKDKGKWCRRRSVQNVIEELSEIKNKFDPSMIIFIDDTLFLEEEWFENFAFEYKNKINIPYACQTRPDLINKRNMILLKESNCSLIAMGIESGNIYIRNQILNRNMDTEQILNAARLIKDYNIELCTLNILGIPSSDLNKDIETLRLNIKCNPAEAVPYLFLPIPGTVVADKAIEMNIFEKNYDFSTRKFYGLGVQPVNLYGGKAKAYQVNNLYHFFPFIVRYPLLLPFVKIIISIPFNNFLISLLKKWRRNKKRVSKYNFLIEQ